MRTALIQKAALRSRNASVASSLQFTRRLQSSWTPAVPAGQVPAYDEAIAFLAQHKEKRLAHLSKLQEKLSEVKEDEERKTLQRELRKAKVEAWVNDPETREMFDNGSGDMDKEVFRWLAERKWRKEGGLDLLMQRLLQMSVVPDLLPSILPTAELSVTVPSEFSNPIEPGSFLPPSALSQPPQLSLQVFCPDTKHYTLLMLDPDSPDAVAEAFTTKVHWIVPNIKISPTASKIDSSTPALLPYLAPNPEKGTPYHRYTFLAFAQPEGVQFSVGGSEGKALRVPEQRTGFNLREWLQEAGLNTNAAVGANMVRGVWTDPIKAARTAKAAASAPSAKRAFSTLSRRSMFASSSRPATAGAAAFGVASTRAYSWTPWKSSAEVVTPHQAQEAVFPVAVTPGAQDATPEPVHLDAATSAAPSTLPSAGPSSSPTQAASAPIHEPILETPHPDLLSGSAANFIPPQPAAAVEGTTRTFEEMLRASPSDMEAVLQSPEAIHAALKVSDLKLLGLDHGWINIVGWLRDGLVGLNQYSGLPWWMTIAAFTVSLRLAIFPWVLKIQSHNARLAAVNPQIKALMEKLNAAKASNDWQATQVINGSMQTLFKDHNVHPLRSLALPLLQMPLFFSMFWALKGLAALPLPMLKDGGFGWVTDLTVADPYYILPTTSMMLTLGVLELGGDGTGDANKSRQMAHFKNAFRVISVGLIPFVGSMPAAVLFYWTFSNGMTLIQASLLKAQWFRRLFNLPTPPVVPPPPGPVEGPPTMMDTWRAARDIMTPSRNPMFQQAMKEHQLRMDELAKQKGLKPGMGEMQEFVQEAGNVAARGQGQAWLEDESRPNVARSAEDARRQRVAAARERRSRPAAKQ